jgi:hypothetical protein
VPTASKLHMTEMADMKEQLKSIAMKVIPYKELQDMTAEHEDSLRNLLFFL